MFRKRSADFVDRSSQLSHVCRSYGGRVLDFEAFVLKRAKAYMQDRNLLPNALEMVAAVLAAKFDRVLLQTFLMDLNTTDSGCFPLHQVYLHKGFPASYVEIVNTALARIEKQIASHSETLKTVASGQWSLCVWCGDMHVRYAEARTAFAERLLTLQLIQGCILKCIGRDNESAQVSIRFWLLCQTIACRF